MLLLFTCCCCCISTAEARETGVTVEFLKLCCCCDGRTGSRSPPAGLGAEEKDERGRLVRQTLASVAQLRRELLVKLVTSTATLS
ncbi:hypothetical protein H0E87_030070 [Populus deltoides]|uniref:Secreted protein n=1 Tax=Populus deltoides TaxID=3696 RepID=A0A8T2WS62_POPDE|nr:hypothetical protein H0E87_030070 [Populus deltoides]